MSLQSITTNTTTTLFTFPSSAYNTATNLLASINAPQLPSSGCTNNASPLPPGLSPGSASINITIQSPLSSPHNKTLQTRHYRIHLPQTYTPNDPAPHPLLLTFHGQYQPPASIENYTQFSLPEINPNAITIYPEGIDYQFLGDPLSPPSSDINDVQFVSDILDDVEARFCVDRNRIYGAGFSNGGGMTGLLACNGTKVGGRFAALAGVAGAYYRDESLKKENLFGEGCVRESRDGGEGLAVIPYLEIHGDADKVVGYAGENGTFPIPDWMRKMAELNGCDFDTSSASGSGLKDLDSNFTQVLNGGNVTRVSYTCQHLQDVVVHLKVKGLGHGWPSTTYFGGILDEYRNGPTTWNASEVIGEWFGRWSLRSSWVPDHTS